MLPASLLLAVQKDTYLWIRGTRQHVPVGWAILIEGNVAHAGDAYSIFHVRVHAYLEVDDVLAPDNQVFPLPLYGRRILAPTAQPAAADPDPFGLQVYQFATAAGRCPFSPDGWATAIICSTTPSHVHGELANLTNTARHAVDGVPVTFGSLKIHVALSDGGILDLHLHRVRHTAGVRTVLSRRRLSQSGFNVDDEPPYDDEPKLLLAKGTSRTRRPHIPLSDAYPWNLVGLVPLRYSLQFAVAAPAAASRSVTRSFEASSAMSLSASLAAAASEAHEHMRPGFIVEHPAPRRDPALFTPAAPVPDLLLQPAAADPDPFGREVIQFATAAATAALPLPPPPRTPGGPRPPARLEVLQAPPAFLPHSSPFVRLMNMSHPGTASLLWSATGRCPFDYLEVIYCWAWGLPLQPMNGVR